MSSDLESKTSKKEKITDKELILINQQSLKDENCVNLKANSMTAFKKKMNFLHSKYKTEQLLVVDSKITKYDAYDHKLGYSAKKKFNKETDYLRDT